MVGADGDLEAPERGDEDELDFAAGIGARDLNLGVVREEVRRYAIEDRRCLRRLDADFLKLLDVLPQRGLVAAGPAGDDGAR